MEGRSYCLSLTPNILVIWVVLTSFSFRARTRNKHRRTSIVPKMLCLLLSLTRLVASTMFKNFRPLSLLRPAPNNHRSKLFINLETRQYNSRRRMMKYFLIITKSSKVVHTTLSRLRECPHQPTTECTWTFCFSKTRLNTWRRRWSPHRVPRVSLKAPSIRSLRLLDRRYKTKGKTLSTLGWAVSDTNTTLSTWTAAHVSQF